MNKERVAIMIDKATAALLEKAQKMSQSQRTGSVEVRVNFSKGGLTNFNVVESMTVTDN